MSEVLENVDELLFRQIHPSWIDNGVPSSQAFTPTPKDDGLLSVGRSSKTTAAAAFNLHVEGKKLSAVSCFGVSVGECRDAELTCLDDPIEQHGDSPADEAHAVADFRPHGTSKQKTLAKRLKRNAVERGILYPK